jgi:hypothetical protein
MSSAQSQVIDLVADNTISVDDAVRLLRALGGRVRTNRRSRVTMDMPAASQAPVLLAMEQYDSNIILK